MNELAKLQPLSRPARGRLPVPARHMQADCEVDIGCEPHAPYAIVLDDHPLIGNGVAKYLQVTRPDLSLRVTTTWAQARQWIQASGCPTLLVADTWLLDSISAADFALWRSHCRCTPLLAIGDDSEPLMIQQARSAGAQGFVHKRAESERFESAFAAVLAGCKWFEPSTVTNEQRRHERTIQPCDLGLTLRQGDVLALLLHGLSNKRIASMLSLSESTVKEHVTGILQRLGVSSRVQAITFLRGRSLTLDCRHHHHARS